MSTNFLSIFIMYYYLSSMKSCFGFGLLSLGLGLGLGQLSLGLNFDLVPLSLGLGSVRSCLGISNKSFYLYDRVVFR